jgi:hypothetical protein
MTKKCHETKEEEAKLRTVLVGSMNRADAERLRQENETLTIELANTRAAMNTYKSMVTTCGDQVRNMNLVMEKRKFEMENYKKAIRVMESESADTAAIGKLYHSVMVARWCEASSNRKYDTLLTETR